MDEQTRKTVALYRTGLTLREVGALLGVDKVTVWRRLQAAGVKCRKRARRPGPLRNYVPRHVAQDAEARRAAMTHGQRAALREITWMLHAARGLDVPTAEAIDRAFRAVRRQIGSQMEVSA